MITGLLAYANILNGGIKHVANSIPATKEKGGSFKDQSFFSEVFVNFFSQRDVLIWMQKTATENNNVYSYEYTRVNNI